jgi:hypothetical protein
MASKHAWHEKVIVILGVVMAVCLPLTLITGAVALIWNGQPIGNTATTTADVFAYAFSAAFFAAFVLRMTEERSRDS